MDQGQHFQHGTSSGQSERNRHLTNGPKTPDHGKITSRPSHPRSSPVAHSPSFRDILTEFLSIFLVLLKKNIASWRHSLSSSSRILFGVVPFVFSAWIWLAIRLCAEQGGTCNGSSLLSKPLANLSQHSVRYLVSEYIWLCVSLAQFAETFKGIPSYIRAVYISARRLNQVRSDLNPARASQGKIGELMTFAYRVFSHASDFVLQPLAILFTSQEIGRSSLFGLSMAESSILVGLMLHVLTISCGAVERMWYVRGWEVLRLSNFVILGLTLVVQCIKGGALEPLLLELKSSWDAARRYHNLAKIAEARLAERAATVTTASTRDGL